MYIHKMNGQMQLGARNIEHTHPHEYVAVCVWAGGAPDYIPLARYMRISRYKCIPSYTN